jgi:hypothetical protein
MWSISLWLQRTSSDQAVSGFVWQPHSPPKDSARLPRRLAGSAPPLRENLALADSDATGQVHLSKGLRSAD